MANRYQFQYSRNLPHLQPLNATLFVTFRLYGAIPISVLEEWQALKQAKEMQLELIEDYDRHKSLHYKEQKRLFARYDHYLDKTKHGDRWLADPHVAQIVCDALHFHAEKKYRLDCFCVMPNHVHVVFKPQMKANGYVLPVGRDYA